MDGANMRKPNTDASPNFEELSVRRVDYETTKQMCLKNHYSHKWQTTFGVANYGVYRDNKLMGVASYGYPMNPKSWPSLTTLPGEQCLELNRLWISDALGKNTETWLLGRSFRLLREDGYRLIQSFADGRLGVGTIYQAANFTYHGYHETIFHRDIKTGETHHDLTFANTEGMRGMLDRNALFTEKRLQTFRVRTYRYLYPLDRGARKSLVIPSEAYPKERTGEQPVPNYRPPVGQIARCFVIAEITDDPRAAAFNALLRTLTDDPAGYIATQRKNPITKQLAREAEQAPMLWRFDDEP